MTTEKNLQAVILLFLISKVGCNRIKGVGNTRMQKLLFLIQKEGSVKIEKGFTFEPYKFGPYSNEVFDNVLSLSSRSMLDLKMDDKGNIFSCKITEKGARKIDDLQNQYTELDKTVYNIVSEYGSLNDELLLLYVYTKYPEYTFRSEIKGQILQIAKKNFGFLQKKARDINFNEKELRVVGA